MCESVPGRRGASRAAGGEAVHEAGEVVDVQQGRVARAVAVGVGIAGGETGLEAEEVVDVERGAGGTLVAVGIAAGGEAGEEPGLGGWRVEEEVEEEVADLLPAGHRRVRAVVG